MDNRWLDHLFQIVWAPQAGSHCFKNTHRENKKMKYNKFLYLPYLIYWTGAAPKSWWWRRWWRTKRLEFVLRCLQLRWVNRCGIRFRPAQQRKLNWISVWYDVIDEQGIHIKYEQNYSRIKFAGKGFTEPLSRPLRLNQAPLQTLPTPPSPSPDPSPDPSDFIEPLSPTCSNIK